jgi:diguanylate cyclase (GGDEF)-like protein
MLIYANVTDLVRNAEQLEKLATTDGMTGLHNRRQFMKLAEAEWGRFQRHGRPLSLLMLDVDYFKSINDRFGHYVGDQVVAQIAALCREGRRVSDVVARIGGEEFALLLPETTAQAAYAVAERLRRDVEVSPLLSNGNGLAVTVSIGVAEAGPGMSGIIGLMKDSDRALYEAKGAGRNRVMCAEAIPIGMMLDAEVAAIGVKRGLRFACCRRGRPARTARQRAPRPAEIPVVRPGTSTVMVSLFLNNAKKRGAIRVVPLIKSAGPFSLANAVPATSKRLRPLISRMRAPSPARGPRVPLAATAITRTRPASG